MEKINGAFNFRIPTSANIITLLSTIYSLKSVTKCVVKDIPRVCSSQ